MATTHDGRLAIVTGGVSGIGRGISSVLARDGATVAALYHRSEVEAVEFEEEIRIAGGRLSTHQVDVRDEEALQATIADITEQYGRPQILVHNAGIANGTPMMAADVPAMRDVFEVNFWAAVTATKAVLRGMMRSKFGRVIYIGSPVATRWATQGSAAYASNKAALHALARQVSAEIAPRGDLTANVVAPGYIRTPKTRHLEKSHEDAILSTMCSERPGTPEEIGEAVSFLASSQASYITGTVLDVDGGFGLKTISRRKRRRNTTT